MLKILFNLDALKIYPYAELSACLLASEDQYYTMYVLKSTVSNFYFLIQKVFISRWMLKLIK